MKIVLLILLSLACLSMGKRQALTDGPYYCTKSQRDQPCGPIRDPVAVITDKGLEKVYVNECEACTDWMVTSYHKIRNCPKKLKDCKPAGSPICAITAGGIVDFEDECTACGSDLGIKQYFRGECPKKIDENIFYCGSHPRPMRRCNPDFVNPVCATDINGLKSTFINGCLACRDTVISFVEGACKEPTTEILTDAIIEQVDPVNKVIKITTDQFQPVFMSKRLL